MPVRPTQQQIRKPSDFNVLAKVCSRFGPEKARLKQLLSPLGCRFLFQDAPDGFAIFKRFATNFNIFITCSYLRGCFKNSIIFYVK